MVSVNMAISLAKNPFSNAKLSVKLSMPLANKKNTSTVITKSIVKKSTSEIMAFLFLNKLLFLIVILYAARNNDLFVFFC